MKKAFPILVIALIFAGCGTAMKTIENAASKWCSYATPEEIDAYVGQAMNTLPDGKDKEKLVKVVGMLGTANEGVCEVVKQLEKQRAAQAAAPIPVQVP